MNSPINQPSQPSEAEDTYQATSKASQHETREQPQESTEETLHHLVPIPAPSHPKQFRAIGVVKGIFLPSQEKLTQGALLTSQETAIDTVLLGKMISLVKKHLDITKPHLWVVYPRTRQEDDQLHFQIAGVWEPETLQLPLDKNSDAIIPTVEDGYFSIRGEVIFYSVEKETVIIKIRQSAKKQGEKPKFFKLKLKGVLPDRPLHQFWDLRISLQGTSLTIKEGTSLGPVSKRKVFKKDLNKSKSWSKKPRRRIASDETSDSTQTNTGASNSFQRPIKKRSAKNDES